MLHRLTVTQRSSQLPLLKAVEMGRPSRWVPLSTHRFQNQKQLSKAATRSPLHINMLGRTLRYILVQISNKQRLTP